MAADSTTATPQPLNCDRDPVRWAREFNDTLQAIYGCPPLEEGWLVGWFANAMMCGEDTYRWRQEAPCATCNDDPTECAKVPGLRHCEKANRETLSAKLPMTGRDMDAPEQPCGGCGKALLIENAWMEDGCPCNTPAGVNNANLYRWRLLHELQQREARESEARQAKIDRLMLEYCPEEMTPEQTAEWARHQKPVTKSATATSKLPQEDDTYWAFQYSDGSWWTDDIFGTREQAERFAKGLDSDLVEGATLREIVIRPTDSRSDK